MAVLDVAPALAQFEAPPEIPAAELRAKIAEADALLARHDDQRALAAYEALSGRLFDSGQSASRHVFACRMGVARLRTAPLGRATERVDRELGTGFAVQTTDGARAACASAAGLALADAAARAARAAPTGAPSDGTRYVAAVIDETRFQAAVWLQRARSLRDTGPLRAAFEALEPSTRAELARLGAGPPVEAADDETLARDLARWRYATEPASVTDCDVDPENRTPRGGMIHCYSTPLPEADEMGGEYPHTIEYFVEGPQGVRYAGGAKHMPGYDCETSVVRETRSWSVLSAARDHLDGVLHVYREGADDERFVDMDITADVCNVAQRKCVTFQLGRRRCETAPSTDRLVCTQDWEASARVRRGVLTFRRVRGAMPGAQSSSILSNPIDLASLGAPTTSRSAAPLVEAPAATVRAPASGCHAEVSDPRPPLNVRADADATSAVAGTLPNGTHVTPRGRRHGWTRIEAPVVGWIWARNLRRVCAP